MKITEENCVYRYHEPFSSEEPDDLWNSCEICGTVVNPKYALILDKLEKKNLLKDKKYLCCICYIIKEINMETEGKKSNDKNNKKELGL